MYILFRILILALAVDASLAKSHPRRLRHRDSLGLDGVVKGLNGALNGVLAPSSPSTSDPAPAATSDAPSNTPSASCNGLLDIGCSSPQTTTQQSASPSACNDLLGLGCSPSSNSSPQTTQENPSTTSPPPPSTPLPSSPSSPSPSCDGLLGLGLDLGCPAPSSTAPPAPSQTSPPATTPPSPPSPAPTSSCDGLLGIGLGCPAPSSNPPTSPPAPPASATQQPSASAAPTTPCDGVLDLVLGCIPSSSSRPAAPPTSASFVPASTYTPFPSHPPPSQTCGGLLGIDCLTETPSQHPSPTATCGDLLGIPCAPTSVAPWTATSPTWSAEHTNYLSTSAVITFPHSNLHHTVTSSAAEPTSLTTAPDTATSNSNYDYLSTVSSLLLNTALPTTTSQTVTDPDQAATTFSLLQVVPTASPTVAPLPSGLPRVILPQPPLDLSTVPNDYVLINVLFNSSLNWEFVATSADSPGQIFAYMPRVIAEALNITANEVLNYDLIVYIPSSYTGPQDVGKLGTIWQSYVPQALVSKLAALIRDPKSSLYTAQSNSIATELALCIDPTFQLDAIAGPSAGAGSSSSASSRSDVRRDAIIGVVSSLGAIAIVIVAYVGYKAYRKRRELAHRRLSDGTGNVGVRPDGQEFDRDSVGGQRRRSFYYAEDSLRGFQSSRADEDGYDHHASNMRERRAVQPSTISTPILRESTMNW